MAKAKKYANRNPHYRIITAEEPSSIAAESYRRIKVGLDYSSVDKKLQVIQLCSSLQGEGKTTTALNLAACYAEDNKKVIVIDLDLRRPKLHRSLHLENKNGITDYLAGNIKIEEAIKHHEANFDVLNRGTKVPYPTAFLGSEGLSSLFQELRKMYEIIIVDCPPILSVSDAIIVSRLCDGCLFIISQLRTEKSAAKEAVNTLRSNNVNILGSVFTEINNKHGSYDYNYKYKYYYQSYYGKKEVAQSPISAQLQDNEEEHNN